MKTLFLFSFFLFSLNTFAACPDLSGTWLCPDPDPDVPNEQLQFVIAQEGKKINVLNPDDSTYEYNIAEGKQYQVYNGKVMKEYVYTLTCNENSIILDEEIEIEENATLLLKKTYTISDDKNSFELKMEAMNPPEDDEDYELPDFVNCKRKI